MAWTSGPDDFRAWDEPGGFVRLGLAPSPTDPKDSAIFVIKAATDGLYYFDPAAKKFVALGSGVKLSEINPNSTCRAGFQ